MNRKLIVGLVLTTSLNVLPAVQRIAPRVVQAARTATASTLRKSTINTFGAMPAARLAVSNSLPKIVATQGQNKTGFDVRAYLTLAGLAVAAGVNEAVKCDMAADWKFFNIAEFTSFDKPLGDLTLIREALKQGANVKVGNDHGERLLWCALDGNDPELALLFLKNLDVFKGDCSWGRGVNCGFGRVHRHHGFDERLTPLCYASGHGYIKVVQELLKNPSADVNSGNWRGETPLYRAAKNGHVDIVIELLKRPEIDVNAKDNLGKTPLWCAVKNGDIKVVRELLKRPEIDVNLALFEASIEGHVEILQELLKRSDVNVNISDSYDRTLLHKAACHGHVEITQLLLQRPDVNVNAVDTDGDTPLDLAIFKGRYDIVRELLKHPDIKANMWVKVKAQILFRLVK